MRRRVVVTGASVISPIGNGREEFWDSLQAMRSGASRIDLPGFGSIVAFMAPPDGAEERFGRKAARRMDRAGRLAAVAAAIALEEAGDLGLEPHEIGWRSASATAARDAVRGVRDLLHRGPDRLSPFAIPLWLTNMAAAPWRARTPARPVDVDRDGLRRRLGRDRGGVRLIRGGRAEAMVAGGADAPLAPS